MTYKRTKQIVFKVEDSFHHRLKMAAAHENITMNSWIERVLKEGLDKEGFTNEAYKREYQSRTDTIK